MKKFILLFLTAAFVLTLSACDGCNKKSKKNKKERRTERNW